MVFAAMTAGAIAGCSSPDTIIPDASSDSPTTDAPAADALNADAVTTDTPAVDAARVDSPAIDSPAVDATVTDAPATDSPVVDTLVVDTLVVDTPRVDAPAVDAPSVDAPPVDVPRVDAPAVDVPATDAPRVDAPVVDAPLVDAPRADVAPVDVVTPPDSGCAGAFTVRVTAPTAMQQIETCTVSGAPVYFNFTAEPSGPATSVEFAWRTPEGTLAPPPWPADTAAPFTARRQVGGMMVDVPPLAVLSRRTDWTLEVTARDSCGRTATTTQPFSLIYTNHGCPNP